jgi:hypothetical protein
MMIAAKHYLQILSVVLMLVQVARSQRLMLTELNRDRLDRVESSNSRIDSRWTQLLLDGNDGSLWTLVLAL